MHDIFFLHSVIFLGILHVLTSRLGRVVDLIIAFVGHDVAAAFSELDFIISKFIHIFLS
jgi:hypothetical protein